jgi:hypothetical protein
MGFWPGHPLFMRICQCYLSCVLTDRKVLCFWFWNRKISSNILFKPVRRRCKNMFCRLIFLFGVNTIYFGSIQRALNKHTRRPMCWQVRTTSKNACFFPACSIKTMVMIRTSLAWQYYTRSYQVELQQAADIICSNSPRTLSMMSCKYSGST